MTLTIKNHITEISWILQKSDMDNPPNILQNVACLIQASYSKNK